MAGYSPLKITGMKTGLVQDREEFILPDDAYPVLQNAYVWRERILRKNAYELLGRLQRTIAVNVVLVAGSANLKTALSLGATASITPGTINLVGSVDGTTYTDPAKNGTLLATGGTGTGGTINYFTGVITITSGAGETITGTLDYYPGLPVMGIRIRDAQNATNNQTVFFDTVYAYIYNGTKFVEFLPGTTWTGTDAEFFWTTNFWIADLNRKLFWATNYSVSGDPIRYTNGVTGTNWIDFLPVINAAGDQLLQALCLLPFKGSMIAFNTKEGPLAGGKFYTNRIRWAAIGNPITVVSAIVTIVNPNAWRDDIRGQGGFIDIPTNEDIVSVGFVRDNLVIYCERSTWQLRSTNRTIQPFILEKVNSELGAESTFSTIQFDTSLMGIGDKGIVECDSYKSERIDIKIPDFVFRLADSNDSTSRIQGIRDFEQRLAYWTVVQASQGTRYPNTRLVYNYENDSWATFTDSLTALGTFQLLSGRNWLNTKLKWVQCHFPWISYAEGSPAIVGGNQQGFIEFLDQNNTNDPSLYISDITSVALMQTVFTSPSHNLISDQIIMISDIPTGTPFSTTLNNKVYQVARGDNSGADPTNKFILYIYNPVSQDFDIPLITTESGFVGYGLISVRDNFIIQSKKFNFIDEGKSIQIGYIDVLLSASEPKNPGALSINVYLDYNDNDASNQLPFNLINSTTTPQSDTFFNQIIPTTSSSLNGVGGSKFWQRVYCSTQASFLTLQYTFSNAQMVGIEQTLPIQIDAQVLWMRRGGRMTQI